MHSFRIYLACALLAAGAPESRILNMLRWRSGESLRLYARINDFEYLTWVDAAGNARVDSIRSSNVGRLAAADHEDQQWLRAAAVADVGTVSPDRLPELSHDDTVAGLVGALGADGEFARVAQQSDADDQSPQ